MANLISREGRNRHSSIENTPQASVGTAWDVTKKQSHAICRENVDLGTEIPGGICTVINIELSNLAGGIVDLNVSVFLDAACNISAFGEMTGTIQVGKTTATKGSVSIMVGVPFPSLGDDSSVYLLCKAKTAGTCTVEKSEIQWKM